MNFPRMPASLAAHPAAIGEIMKYIDKLIEVVPQTFGEAVLLYPWIAESPSHEWDNRTTLENTIYVIRHLSAHAADRKSSVAD